jgi:N-acetyl-anhydromuramyl-L-alanine amidase AmpD
MTAVRYPTAEWIPATRHSGRFHPIGVCIHVMQGYRRTMDRWARDDTGPEVSAHFGIDRAGQVAQYVSLDRVAWHAGRIDSQPPTWPLYRHGTNPNTQLIGIELEGFSVNPGYEYDYLYDTDHPWPAGMIAAAARVAAWCFEHVLYAPPFTHPIRQLLIGHSEIAVLSRADDPGAHFPWTDFRSQVLDLLGVRPAEPLVMLAPGHYRVPAGFTLIGPGDGTYAELEVR